mmetsp:Transcript_24099/g.38810  ORF Transcript_24099/g.38810 Transcript_24099/m.38810 type:complete len:410 (+) Transcript_24099:40-1269(+)
MNRPWALAVLALAAFTSVQTLHVGVVDLRGARATTRHDAASACAGHHRSELTQVLSLRGGDPEYDSKDAEKFDRVLWDMLAEHPDDIHFLNTVFNFLQRRTPCFNGPDAERNYQILIDTLSKQKQQYIDHVAKGKASKAPEPMPALKKTVTAAKIKTDPLPHVAKDVPSTKSDPISSHGIDDKELDEAFEGHPANVEGHVEGGEAKGKQFPVEGLGTVTAYGADARGGGVGNTTEVLQTPVNNGGRTDQYVWSQSLNELSMEVFLPQHIPTKSISVDVTPTHISVAIKNGDLKTTLLHGEFEERIKPAELTWTREDDLLVITVIKHGDLSWWSSALKGHLKVDVQKIEPQNSNLHDLDDDMRQTVEKMMYDQKMKAQGKPTLDESKKKDQMKKFMGQHPEMDFSKCKFN